ncbi:MAG TPA: helix-turn-helix domain-containing protein, partial [Longimicrobiales bacterium]
RAFRSLQERVWSGNVRELQNAIEHSVVLLDPGCDIEPENVASLDDSGQADVAVPISTYQDDEAYHSARDRIVAQFEKNYLRWLVSRARGNMSKAARIAGVDRTTLYRLMEKHELQRDTLVVMQ